MAKTFNLVFDGYWRDEKKDSIPNKAGIYIVYRCVHNVTEKTVSIQELLYIGESNDARSRIATHNKANDWNKHLKKGEELCFSFAPITPEEDRLRAEAALIYKHQPTENGQCTEKFTHEKTTINASEKCHGITSSFTVWKDE